MTTTTLAAPYDGDEELRQSIEQIEGETDVEKLTQGLLSCVALTVRTLVLLGVYIRRLETLGADVLNLRVPNMGYFRRIAHGQLLPEVFIELAGTPHLLRKVSLLSVQDQETVNNATPLEVLLPGGDHLLVAPKDMTFSQVRQVFANGSIRSKPQQAAWLADQQQQAALAKRPPLEVAVDRKRNGIRVGDLFISAGHLAGYLAQLATK